MHLRLEKYKIFFFPVLLVLFFITEGINKVAFLQTHETLQSARLIKGVVLLICLVFLTLNKEFTKYLLALFFISISFCLGQFFLDTKFDHQVVIFVFKYLFLIALILLHNLAFKNESSELLIRVFEYIIIINSALVIIGFCFNIHIFETYKWNRFGYNGLLVSSATSTYFYTISLFHFFIKYQEKFFIKPIVLFCLLASVLVGTKSLYAVMAFMFFIYVIVYVSGKLKQIFILGLLITIALVFYFLFFELETFNEIRKTQGLITSILSYRDNIFQTKMLPFISEKWHLINYLFGGISDVTTRPQMMFFDLIYFFGFVGALVYIIVLTKAYFNFRSATIGFTMISVLVLLGSVGGNILLNATVAIYLVVFRESIKSIKN